MVMLIMSKVKKNIKKKTSNYKFKKIKEGKTLFILTLKLKVLSDFLNI